MFSVVAYVPKMEIMSNMQVVCKSSNQLVCIHAEKQQEEMLETKTLL